MISSGNNLRGAKTVKDSQGFNASWGKDSIILGERYRLIFRKFWESQEPDGLGLVDESAGQWNIPVAMEPTRQLNGTILGRSSVVIKEYSEDLETGKVTDESGLGEYNRMSKVLHGARMRKEIKNAQDDAKRDATLLGTPIDERALEDKIRKITLAYCGDDNAKPAKIYPTESLLVGGTNLATFTDAMLIPVDDKSQPDWSKAKVISVPLNNKRIERMLTILDTVEYIHEDKPDFLEVSYNYIGTSRQDAGQNNKFEGVSQNNSLSVISKDLWETNKGKLERIGKTKEQIKAKCFSLNSKFTAANVKAAFDAAISKDPGILVYIDFEADDTAYTAETLLKQDFLNKAPSVKAKLEALIEEAKKAEEPAPEEITADESALAEASKMGSIKELSENTSAMAAVSEEEFEETGLASGIQNL